MHRSRFHRDHFRRSGGAGIQTILVNGTPLVGPVINIDSPMASLPSASTVAIDNGNVKTLADAATVVGADCDLNQAFFVPIAGNRTIAALTNPKNGEKVTFIFAVQAGGPYTPVWPTAGAGDYLFANAASPQGVTLAAVNALAAACPVGSEWSIGFEWSSNLSRAKCVALAGYWP